MDHGDLPKARRPLPTPGAAAPSPQPRPSTPVTGSTQRPISPSHFYATKPPPPLPSRPKNAGSSHTTYLSTVGESVRYGSPSEYREPELVAVEPAIPEDEQMPALVPPDYDWDKENGWPRSDQPSTSAWMGAESGGTWGDSGGTWPYNRGADDAFSAMDYINTPRDNEVPIGGRSDFEESKWWSQDERARSARPGPGMLPPVLAEALHDPNHSLFSVNIVSIPQPSSSAPREPTSTQASGASDALPRSANQLPTEQEVRDAIPHPNAYYCPRENAWVLLLWKKSVLEPPLAASFRPIPYPLPSQDRRKRTPSCTPDGRDVHPSENKTHHFHYYPKSIDSLKLSTPYEEDPWAEDSHVRQAWRQASVFSDDSFKHDDGAEGEGKLLDLYVCCQCQVYCVVSDVIPGIVPRRYLEEFSKDKRGNPTAGKTPEHTLAVGVETLLTAIENKVFRGNHRLIKINSTGFQSKLGWNNNIRRIFARLEFTENHGTNDGTLMGPSTDLPSGAIARQRLIRAWIELSAWLADFRRQNSAVFRDIPNTKNCIQIDSAREMYQQAVGAHHDQIPRGELQGVALEAVRPLHDAWLGLGLTPTSYSADLLAFAYLAQCRCDPGRTPQYFTYLTKIVEALHNAGTSPASLQELIVMEQSRDRFTLNDIQKAAENLGFGLDGPLQVEYDEDVEEKFVENAWRDAAKRSWKDTVRGSEIVRIANEALRVIAEARGSTKLRQLWENGKNHMNPEKAYDTLEIPKETDDHMLITVFNMRLEESAMQMDKMREALTVIAEVRDSERLRQFLATGQDPGDIVAPVSPDLPRGLNQLGNTCYLNSLLQYFYTIKDLRDAVMPMQRLDPKAVETEKYSDEDIKEHRVGNREITRGEIVRSKKFIHHLSNLFFEMEYAQDAAVTPSLDLAKLALTASQDEVQDEEPETDKGGSESSDDSDATLVDGEPSRGATLSSFYPSVSSPDANDQNSVLGKRARDLDKPARQESVMDVETLDVDGFVMVSSPKRNASPALMDQDSPKSKSKQGSPGKDNQGDVIMKPAPPPKKKEVSDTGGGMMFGRQHDVAECMDNCMFQMELALLIIGSQTGAGENVIKRLFFGKTRQILTPIDSRGQAPTSEKSDIFGLLPVMISNTTLDIYDGLSTLFDDIVDRGDGGKARMELSLVDIPPLLQVEFRRVQFDEETKQAFKNQAYIKFGETIYLDRFMDNADPRKKSKSKKIQRDLKACRARIQLLSERKNGSIGATLDRTADYLIALQQNKFTGIEDGLAEDLKRERQHVEREIAHLTVHANQLKQELELLWEDSRNYAYDLTSVFIHRGSTPLFGHYFFYSRHLPEDPDSWFKYNDSDVSVVPKDEVFKDTTGSNANPYLLVFERRGTNVIETVKRFDVNAAEIDTPTLSN